MVDSSKCFGAQITGFPSKFQNQFYSYSRGLNLPHLFLPLSLHQIMIQRAPMGSIHRPSNPGSGSTEETNFVQCVDGQEPQIHAFLCLGLDKISRKFHPTAQVEVIAGTAG